MNSPDNGMDDKELLLSRYLDGDVDEAERRQLEARLADDPELARSLEWMRRVDQLTHVWGEHVPATDADAFVAQARRRREAFDQSRRIVRVYRLFAPMAAAAVLALVVGGYLWLHARAPARLAVTTTVAVVSVGPNVDVHDAVAVVSFSQGEAPQAPLRTQAGRTLLVAAGGGRPALRAVKQSEGPFF